MRAALIVLVLATSPAHAEPPCARCTLDVPAKLEGPAPLLVVLHGDRDHAKDQANQWRAAAKGKGVVLLALECPASLGCRGSWWQWAGDPAWVIAQVDAVARQVSIDPARIYLAGWSGGASYIGMNAPAWAERFAGIVIHGGGMAPQAECPGHVARTYFLVGDANPLHRLAVDLRTWTERCDGEVTWDLVKRGDHAAEERALTRTKAGAILDWLRGT